MHVRPFLPSDLPDMATIHATALADDELFSWLHPRMAQYPGDYRRCTLRLLRMRAVSPEFHIFVCVRNADDDTVAFSDVPDGWCANEKNAPGEQDIGGEIVGFAMWNRAGPTGDLVVQSWQQPNSHSVLALLDRYLLTLEHQYVNLLRMDQSQNTTLARSYRSAMSNKRPFARLPAYWHLRGLVVAPWAQRRGVGRLLVQFGKQRARDEGVPVCLQASEAGVGTYRKEGFGIIGYSGFPVARGPDAGRTMVWDPTCSWVKNAMESEAWVKSSGAWQTVDLVWKEAPGENSKLADRGQHEET